MCPFCGARCGALCDSYERRECPDCGFVFEVSSKQIAEYQRLKVERRNHYRRLEIERAVEHAKRKRLEAEAALDLPVVLRGGVSTTTYKPTTAKREHDKCARARGYVGFRCCARR
jgi:glutaredoxin